MSEKNLTREQRLENLLRFEEGQLKDSLDHIYGRRWKTIPGAVYMRLAALSRVRGVHSFFIGNDLTHLKQNFFVASKLSRASIGLEGGEEFESYMPFLIGLLSDSQEVVDWLTTAETNLMLKERNNPRMPQFVFHMWQLLLRGEHDALQAKIELRTRHHEGAADSEAPYKKQDFFSLVVARDKEGLEQLVERESLIKCANPLIEDFVAGWAMIQAKICWIKDIPVQVNNPLVPMELLPVKPLSHYDETYDFLRSGWKPPVQGFLRKIARWI